MMLDKNEITFTTFWPTYSKVEEKYRYAQFRGHERISPIFDEEEEYQKYLSEQPPCPHDDAASCEECIGDKLAEVLNKLPT